jgi:adenylate kinase
VEARLRELGPDQGVLLDGFPRTRPQVDILDRILDRLGRSLSAAVLLEVAEAEILRRLSGRRVCRTCGHTYHLEFKPPRREGICDLDGGELVIRDDDRESVIRNRLRVYERETAPVVECYRGRGILRTVPANGTAGEVAEKIQQQIRQVAA